MNKKPTYEELEQRVRDLEKEVFKGKQAEDALRKSENKLKTVLSISPVGIGLVVNRKLDWANETMYRMLGYEKNFFLGRSSRLLYPDDEGFEWTGKQLYAGIKESGTGYVETQWIRKDGTVFDCILRACSLDPSDPAKGQIVAATDFSELKQTQEALKECDLRHRILVENANEAIFIAQDEVIKFPNPRAEELTCYSVEELARTSFVEFIHPEDRNMVLDRYKRRLKGEALPSTYSFRLININNEELLVQLNTVLIDWEGRPATLCFLRDLTEQKKLENQLQRAQKMESLGTLAGGVAHDLNNVLSGIVSYPELLLLSIPEDSHLRKPLLTIQKSGKKAVDIVQDLLTLARRGVVATEVVNLNQIINSYLESPECKKTKECYPDVKIKTSFEAHLLNIMGSSFHLSKTVMNLINNAAEAINDSGNIFISTENRYIDKPLKGYDDVEEGDYVVFKISDSGIGISSGDMEKIFEPFYSKKVMGKSGTGLGMAVVWGTVKDHNGYIDIQSTEGKGTTLTLYFPATRKEISERKNILPIEDYMGNGESILIVDDFEGQREIAAQILKKLGYAVRSVASGEDAVSYMKENAADLIVLDMIMDPGLDGLDTYRKILELHPGQKAIIASGFSETDRIKKAQKLGAGGYIKKPYTLKKIGLAVKEELGK